MKQFSADHRGSSIRRARVAFDCLESKRFRIRAGENVEYRCSSFFRRDPFGLQINHSRATRNLEGVVHNKTRRSRSAGRRSTQTRSFMHISRYREKSAVKTARKNRLEIIAAQLSRREMVKFGLIGASGYLVCKHGLSHWASGGLPIGCDART